MTHRPKSEPRLDSAQEKHLQHTVRIQNTTSLQTSPSRQVQELPGPAHHTTRWLHQDSKTKSLPTWLHHPRYCAQFVQHTILCRLLQNEPCGPFQSSCLNLSRSRRSWSSQALRNCVTIAVYAVSFLVPARTICRSSRERRAFWRSRYRRISSSKTVRPVCSCRHGASVNVSSSSTISYSAQSRQRSFQRWLDDRVVVLQISRFGSFGHVGEPRSSRGEHAALSRCSPQETSSRRARPRSRPAFLPFASGHEVERGTETCVALATFWGTSPTCTRLSVFANILKWETTRERNVTAETSITNGIQKPKRTQ